LTLVDGGGEIDLAIASDCIYNPTYHEVLLQSAAGVLSKENGVFIVGYSFHMNVPPEQVLDFFDIASSKFGLEVVSELKQEYDGQRGIGDKDKSRGVVYIKVLAYKDSIYFR
jgi:predicted nicotinamide N-methyase